MDKKTEKLFEKALTAVKRTATHGATVRAPRSRPREPADQIAARELKIYIDNDGDLYRQQTTSILKNLITKKARGVYDREKAVKLFMYLTESGAKKYAREFGSRDAVWHEMFTKPTREAAAREMVEEFEEEARLGNYDLLLPKKYRK